MLTFGNPESQQTLVCFLDLKFAPNVIQQAGELQIQHTSQLSTEGKCCSVDRSLGVADVVPSWQTPSPVHGSAKYRA